MKKYFLLFTAILILAITSACTSQTTNEMTFAEARSTFETTLTRQVQNGAFIPDPPEGVFDLIHYPSEVGDLAAFISSNPNDGQRHPLIIWVVGGWSNGISSLPWSYPRWENDQTASAFREAGILVMYPSFRGGNSNLGYQETLYGEIDDIVSAFEYAAKLPYVDPNRIYLGGHSTGGTRVLLTAAYTDIFRAIFSFGPVDEIRHHNQSQFTFDIRNAEENRMRSPIYWLEDINTPTFIIEGADGNADEVRRIERASQNTNIHTFLIDGADHFDILAPATLLAAQKILRDNGNESNISITTEELQAAMRQRPTSPMPPMTRYFEDVDGFSLLIPAIWGAMPIRERGFAAMSGLLFFSEYAADADNFWDSSVMNVETFVQDEEMSYSEFVEIVGISRFDVSGGETIINGRMAFIAVYEDEYDFNTIAAFQTDEWITVFFFWLPKEHGDYGAILFETMINSIEFT